MRTRVIRFSVSEVNKTNTSISNGALSFSAGFIAYSVLIFFAWFVFCVLMHVPWRVKFQYYVVCQEYFADIRQLLATSNNLCIKYWFLINITVLIPIFQVTIYAFFVSGLTYKRCIWIFHGLKISFWDHYGTLSCCSVGLGWNMYVVVN